MLQKLTAIPTITILWLITTLFRILPLNPCWKIGNLLGRFCHTIMPARRNVIHYNLNIVAKQTPDIQVTDTLVKNIFIRSITNLVCSVKTYTMPPSQIENIVKIKIHPEYTKAVTSKTGSIFCLAHMGNWEILSKIGPLMHPETFPFGALYRPLDNKAADNYVANQRIKYGCQMFPKGTPISKLSTFLKSGGSLGILADQRAGGSKNNRPFFGALSSRSKLPAILHLRTQAPLFSLAVYSEKPGNWSITIDPIKTPQNANTEEIVNLITRRYEQTFTNHLLDIFWLHTYWRKKRDT